MDYSHLLGRSEHLQHHAPGNLTRHQTWAPSSSRFGNFIIAYDLLIIQNHNVFAREIKPNTLIILQGLMCEIFRQHATFYSLLVMYWMSYLDNSICQWVILPVKVGFSKMYFIGSILEINKVVWQLQGCVNRLKLFYFSNFLNVKRL